MSPRLARTIGTALVATLCFAPVQTAHADPQAPLPKSAGATQKLGPKKPDFSHIVVDRIEVRDPSTHAILGEIKNGPDGKMPLASGAYLPVPLQANKAYHLLIIVKNTGQGTFTGTLGFIYEVRPGTAQAPLTVTPQTPPNLQTILPNYSSSSALLNFTTQVGGRHWFKAVYTP